MAGRSVGWVSNEGGIALHHCFVVIVVVDFPFSNMRFLMDDGSNPVGQLFM